MIEGLKPYAQYTDSGLTTIGVLPNHWRILRAKTLFREIDERSVTGKETLLSVSHISGVRRRSETNANMFLAKSNIGYKRCRPNDLVINTMWAWMGALGVSHLSGIVSPAYAVYRPLIGTTLGPGYVEYLLRTPAYVAEYTLRSSGIHSSRLRLYPEHFLRIPLVVPPADEQVAIVRFLNHANRRIDRFIRAKKKLIALLNEQKQAIIHRAVTRGLDPNVPMKDSGVPWVGEVPAHWEVRRLKSIARIRYGLGQPPPESDEGVPLIRATNVDDGRVLPKNMMRVDPSQVPKGRDAFLCPGEIIVVRSGALTADSAIVPKEYDGAIAGYDMVVSVRTAFPDFIALAIRSKYVKVEQLMAASMRAAQPHLNSDELGVALLLIPPREEQRVIISYVGDRLQPVEDVIAQAEREIALIREYCTRLIADVVTGQLDVREAVKGLPVEEADGGEPVDAGAEIDEAEIDDREQGEAA